MVKKQKMIKILEDMRDSVEMCAVFDLTFYNVPNLTKEDRIKLEEYLKQHYKLWTDSWILPQIEELIEELQTHKKT